MGMEDDAVFGQAIIDVDLADSCEKTCSPASIEARLDDMVGYAVASYTMNRVMMPGLADMPTTVTIEASATCAGGKRNLLGRFKCAVESTCELNAITERKEKPTE